MRLLIFNWRDLKHPRAGGSEVYAQNLAGHWAAAGHNVTFFCGASEGLPGHEHFEGYQIVRRGGRIGVYAAARKFFESEGRGNFDAILDVVNTRPFLTPRWSTGVRTVALIHQLASEVWRYEVPLPAALLGRYLLEPKWLAAYRDFPVLTVSKSSCTSLYEAGLRNVTVVHEGVDPPLDRAIPPKARTPTILFVGRLSQNKRPMDAIEAHRLLRQRIPEARLWIVGDGPEMGRLRRAAGDGVTFYGRTDAATKQDLMASAHALIATSVREGWGLTVSEAARLGTRSVGYDVPGLSDSIPAGSGVLSQATPQAMADKLAIYLPRWQHEGRMDLGTAGVVSWQDVATEVLEFIVR